MSIAAISSWEIDYAKWKDFFVVCSISMVLLVQIIQSKTKTVTSRQGVLYRIASTLNSIMNSDNFRAKVDQRTIPGMGTHILQSILQSDWRVTIVASILLTFLLTYVTTSLKSIIVVRGKNVWKKPPTLPYWTPFVGSSISLLWDASGFCSEIT